MQPATLAGCFKREKTRSTKRRLARGVSCGKEEEKSTSNFCKKKKEKRRPAIVAQRERRQQHQEGKRQKTKGDPWRESERAQAAKKREKERLLGD
ncbi:hypothetical protein ACOSQ2_003306 [Xanthoceras sorbifolium]